MNTRDFEIMLVWEMAAENFPDKSTEFLIAIVCDQAGCEYEDVIAALARANEADS